MPYVKLDCGILDSTLWVQSPSVRIVFLTMLAMADSEGVVRATAPGISRRANLPLASVRSALEVLTSPDPDSRTIKDDGKRVNRIDGGFEITNYLAYRERDYTSAERQKRWRARQKAQEQGVTRYVTAETRYVTQAEAEAEAKAKDKSVSSEPVQAPEPADGIEAFPVVGKNAPATGWLLDKPLLDALVKAYPGTSVKDELDKARAWLIANPTRRKTAKGMPRFINAWLERAQNGRSGTPKPANEDPDAGLTPYERELRRQARSYYAAQESTG